MQLKLEKGLYDPGSIEKKPLCHDKLFQIDLQEMGGGPDVVVDGGDVEMGGVGDEKVVVIGGGIVVKIGISQLDWPEMKSEFEFKFGQFSNNKQILSVSW